MQHAGRAFHRRNSVLDRMVLDGYISQEKADANARPLGYNRPSATKEPGSNR